MIRRRPSRPGLGSFTRLSSRLHAQLLSRSLLAGEAAETRSLIVDVDADLFTCVYCAGDQALAVWRFDVGAVLTVAGAAGVAPAITVARARGEAAHLLEGSRLEAVRPSLDRVLVVHAAPTPLGRFLATIFLDALFAGDALDAAPPIVEYAAPVSARAAAESRSASSAR